MSVHLYIIVDSSEPNATIYDSELIDCETIEYLSSVGTAMPLRFADCLESVLGFQCYSEECGNAGATFAVDFPNVQYELECVMARCRSAILQTKDIETARRYVMLEGLISLLVKLHSEGKKARLAWG